MLLHRRVEVSKWLNIYLAEKGEGPNHLRAVMDDLTWRFLAPVWPIAWSIGLWLRGRQE